jgi:uncharacterized protein YqhQ
MEFSETTLKKKYDPNNPMLVGGQAVIEGVMMKGPNVIATAVRRSNGKIELKIEKFKSIMEKYKWLKIPIIRGGIGLVEMLVIGIKTLNFSAEIAMEDAELEKDSSIDKNKKKKKGTSKFSVLIAMVVAFLIGVAVFFIFPLFITTRVFNLEKDVFLFNLTAGIIRLFILLTYVILISLMKDIKRIFQYHGAEHKTVLTFEGSKDLTIDNAKLFTTFHPRCGTSFLIMVMFVAILSFSILDAIVLKMIGYINLPIRLMVHLPFIPILGGISYELIKFSAKRADSGLGKMLITPGLWLQRITTKEPDDSQIEVALCALNAALEYNEENN